ncbi:MAG: FecR domain-containing protein [Verrucomicrobiales bacterium]|nr:FecR domain-containing protein [Verrucomicrobiales bacterium]
MNPPKLQDLTPEEQDWVDAYLDGTITPQEFEALQNRMADNAPLRALMRRYLSLDNSLHNETAELDSTTASPWLEAEEKTATLSPNVISLARFTPIAAAAAIAFLLGLAVMLIKDQQADPGVANDSEPSTPKASANGFAVINRLLDPVWTDLGNAFTEGDTMGSETFQLTSGTAEIQFFSGAVMTVEGPAEIALKSAWEASCIEGSVRMQVPPAARGFKLQAPSTEIIDLGTEFGLKVAGGQGHVEVFDGEISIRQKGAQQEKLVTAGLALDLPSDGSATPATSGSVPFPDIHALESRDAEQKRSDFARWQSHRDTLAKDDRLIAYYTFNLDRSTATIPDASALKNPELDGTVILAEPVDGRWPGIKPALEFRRPGARVRVNIPGEFPAFSFVAWVRIDSLDRQYSALFMGDGYENGEPHWQIRDDGCMMLSVMIDDALPHPHWPDNRYHHVYLSPPMWNLSMSGQWLHLASVYDPQNRAASHYLNGKRLSVENIEPEFFTDTLRIGNGEIGNWGQPFREDPTFAIRHLNGRMDEIAIFKTALGAREVSQLYNSSRAARQ